MRVFETYLNGKKLVRAGVGEDGVMVVSIEHVMKEARNETKLRVGGLISSEVHVDWAKRELQTGDEITIKIREDGAVDRPMARERRNHQDELKQQKRYL